MSGAWSVYSKFEVWGDSFELRDENNKAKEFRLNLEGTGEH